jgi:hypothetical protein
MKRDIASYLPGAGEVSPSSLTLYSAELFCEGTKHRFFIRRIFFVGLAKMMNLPGSVS